jgi:UDP-2,3-diacylglucosamine hydrolase
MPEGAEPLPKLGVIAGNGSLPLDIIRRCRETGRPVFVLAVQDEADAAALAGVDHVWFRMGAAETVIRHLRDNKVQEVVMAGGVRRPSLTSLRPDWRAAKMIARIGLRALGDDGLLTAVKREFEAEGFKVVGAHSILGDRVTRIGTYGKLAPDEQAQADIAHGLRIVRALGALDIGQAVVVQQGLVLGVEAIEGTDALLARAGDLRRDGSGGVLVKAKKPGQDAALDLPTIGPRTIELAHQAGLRGVAVEAGGSLVLEQDAVVERADRLGLFVIGVAP